MVAGAGLRAQAPEEVLRRAAAVRLLLFDVDGVLTDGRLFIDGRGREHKAFHVRDGHGIRLALEGGLEVAWISARRSGAVRRRARELGVTRLFEGAGDKLAVKEQLGSHLDLRGTQMAFTTDDVQDLPLLRCVGLAVAVADGHHEVKRAAHWVTPSPGGYGAVREVCELVLEAHDHTVSAPQRRDGPAP